MSWGRVLSQEVCDMVSLGTAVSLARIGDDIGQNWACMQDKARARVLCKSRGGGARVDIRHGCVTYINVMPRM